MIDTEHQREKKQCYYAALLDRELRIIYYTAIPSSETEFGRGAEYYYLRKAKLVLGERAKYKSRRMQELLEKITREHYVLFTKCHKPQRILSDPVNYHKIEFNVTSLRLLDEAL